MTSQEIILDEIKRLEHTLNIYEKDNNKHYIEIIKTNIEVNKLILKDLEVLDILKENAHLYVHNVNKDVKAIQINITTCNDNFNKVEEWLSNGR